jgi:hypothetical protein
MLASKEYSAQAKKIVGEELQDEETSYQESFEK